MARHLKPIIEHIGHDISVVTYGSKNDNASVECNDCYEVLVWEEKDEIWYL